LLALPLEGLLLVLDYDLRTRVVVFLLYISARS
jgi:hypothetical protein